MANSIINEMLEMTYPDDYYKNVIEPAKLGKGPGPSMGQMMMKSQPFKAVSLPFQEMMNPGKYGSFRSSGTPMARAITGPLSTAARGFFSGPAAGIMAALTPTPANADEASMTVEDFAALNQGVTPDTISGNFGTPGAIITDGPGTYKVNPGGQTASLINKSTNVVDVDAARAAIERAKQIENQQLASENLIAAAPTVFDINTVGDPALNPGSVNVFGVDPFGVNENLIDRGNPLGDSRVVSEEMGLVGGIPDRGRGMTGPAVEMIGGQAVPVGDVLGRQMALEKADFYEDPKSKVDLGSVISLAGLLSGSNVIKGLGMIANQNKIGKMAGNIRSGLGSLGSKVAGKLRGINPITGKPNTQAQYEQARADRQAQRRTDRMIDRIVAGKSTRSNPRDAGKTKAQKDAISAALRESRRGQQYTDKDSSGSTGSGGRKVVCTMMNERYGFGSFRNKIWMKFHENHGPEYEKGYHAIFLPLVKIAKGEGKINTAVRKVLEHMGRHVTADMFKIMKGKKRDPLGRIYRAIFEPACRIIGKIKSALGRG